MSRLIAPQVVLSLHVWWMSCIICIPIVRTLPLSLHKGQMKFFENGYNGEGWEIFTRNGGEARNGGRWEIFKVSLHSWQRGANPLIYCLSPLFQLLSTPPPPPHLLENKPPPPLFFLLSCFFSSMSDHTTFDVLFNDNINLHMSSFSTRRTLMCVLCNKASSLLRSNIYNLGQIYLISHTQTHTSNSGACRLTHSYKCIFTLPVFCSQLVPLLHSMIKWIIHWYQKITFHNVVSFQKFICKSHISVD